jgi:hypothetical protein
MKIMLFVGGLQGSELVDLRGGQQRNCIRDPILTTGLSDDRVSGGSAETGKPRIPHRGERWGILSL